MLLYEINGIALIVGMCVWRVTCEHDFVFVRKVSTWEHDLLSFSCSVMNEGHECSV